ncbi:IclR family transcriptional regulator [Jannaschia sp. R86511]|uniref:IclR family transcriptional regulator n=1 Tax=Jannaschia sp. R86511 TaxID=3093853 RepID=UPI0036D41629
MTPEDTEPAAGRDPGHTIARAVDVLTFVAGCAERTAPGVVEVARALGREKSVVSRQLRVLAEAGLLRRDPVGLGYRVGPRLFTIAARAHDGVLTEHARSVVDELSAGLRERIDVLVRDGGTVVTIATAAPATPLQAIGRVGFSYPLLATAAGRCFLVDSSDADVLALHGRYGSAGGGPAAPDDAAEVLRRVREIDTLGYARADEEIDRSLSAYAVPVRGADGSVIAAVSCAGPTERLADNADVLTRALQAAATTFAERLGGPRTSWSERTRGRDRPAAAGVPADASGRQEVAS